MVGMMNKTCFCCPKIYDMVGEKVNINVLFEIQFLLKWKFKLFIGNQALKLNADFTQLFY